MLYSFLAYIALAYLTTFLAVIFILKTRIAQFALDVPNQRSLHTKLTPRVGGLAIMISVLLTWAIMLPVSMNSWYWLFFPLILTLTSLIDDIFHLSAKWRLLVQLIVSTTFLILIMPQLAWWLIALLTLLITWMTNLYNFMDGSDGLAGGMGFFGFSAYAIAAFLMGDMQIALMSTIIATACFAFLAFNFHPAKIFMGDSGSIPLGFLAGAIGIYGYFYALWPTWFPLLVFSPFVIDATVTLIKRQIKGEKIWQAHRSHYYQRLVQMGWGHRKTALVEYTLMMAVALNAIFLLHQNDTIIFFVITLCLIIYFMLMRLIDKYWIENKKLS